MWFYNVRLHVVNEEKQQERITSVWHEIFLHENISTVYLWVKSYFYKFFQNYKSSVVKFIYTSDTRWRVKSQNYHKES